MLAVRYFQQLPENIPGEHGADAQGESGNRADDREDDAAECDTAKPYRLVLQQIDGQDQDRLQVWLHGVHVHTDGCAGQAYRNYDERGYKGTNRGCTRIRGREDGLDVGLRAEHADNQ